MDTFDLICFFVAFDIFVECEPFPSLYSKFYDTTISWLSSYLSDYSLSVTFVNHLFLYANSEILDITMYHYLPSQTNFLPLYFPLYGHLCTKEHISKLF